MSIDSDICDNDQFLINYNKCYITTLYEETEPLEIEMLHHCKIDSLNPINDDGTKCLIRDE